MHMYGMRETSTGLPSVSSDVALSEVEASASGMSRRKRKMRYFLEIRIHSRHSQALTWMFIPKLATLRGLAHTRRRTVASDIANAQHPPS